MRAVGGGRIEEDFLDGGDGAGAIGWRGRGAREDPPDSHAVGVGVGLRGEGEEVLPPRRRLAARDAGLGGVDLYPGLVAGLNLAQDRSGAASIGTRSQLSGTRRTRSRERWPIASFPATYPSSTASSVK